MEVLESLSGKHDLTQPEAQNYILRLSRSPIFVHIIPNFVHFLYNFAFPSANTVMYPFHLA